MGCGCGKKKEPAPEKPTVLIVNRNKKVKIAPKIEKNKIFI